MNIFDISPEDLSAILSESSTFRRIFIEYTASNTGHVTAPSDDSEDWRQLRINSLRHDIIDFAHDNKANKLGIMKFLRDKYSCTELQEVFPDQKIENYSGGSASATLGSIKNLTNYLLTLV